MRGAVTGSTTNLIRNWQNIAGVVILLIATTVTVAFLLSDIIKTPIADRYISMTGMTVCLPHKATGPHTLECTTGLRGDDDRHYALSGTEQSQLPLNATIEVTGRLSEPAPNSLYDIAGTIEVSSLKDKL